MKDSKKAAAANVAKAEPKSINEIVSILNSREVSKSPESTETAGTILKTVVLALFAALTIGAYYQGNSHAETATAASSFSTYVVSVLLAYGTYRSWTWIRGSKQISFSFLSIAGTALAHLLVLTFFFPFWAEATGGPIALFLKMLGFLALPVGIVFATSAFGLWVLKRAWKEHESLSFETKTVAAMSGGLATYLFALSALGSVFPYVIATALIPSAVMLAVGWRGALEILSGIHAKKFTFPLANWKDQSRLISAEFFFFVIVFVLSVNFVNVVRPMPIGWDDLGVYMNFPKLMAMNESIGGLGTAAWQSFTAIGFMFQSATQAFFLNQVGGVLSVVFLVLIVGRLLSAESDRKHVIHVPLMVAAAFYAMPMIVFQQAKDMKVDPALFALTIAAIFLTFEAIRRREEYGTGVWKFFAASGFVAGIAFAVKFTTLMTFLAIAAVVSYAGMGLAGFFGFFALFLGTFTRFRLWDFLNVNYPKDDPALLTAFSIGMFALAALFIGWGVHKHRATVVKTVGVPMAAFALAAMLAFAPWMAKNVAEAKSAGVPIGIWTLLGGYAEVFVPDYSKVRPVEEIRKINDEKAYAAMSASGKTTNEDLGRYFGYENGINNYLKLPLNLTFQRNQPGEYTEISFVYLALLPGILMFLSYRRRAFGYAALGMLAFEYAYFFSPEFSPILTGIFSQWILPGGYLAIAALFIAPLAWFHFTLDKSDRRNGLFLLNFAFLAFYGFIFAVSAYGIVWYGIAVYFSLLLAIAVAGDEVSDVSDERPEAGIPVVKTVASVVIFTVFATYFLNSTIPHGWNNFRGSGFDKYKAGAVTQDESTFESHPDYVTILSAINLRDPKKAIADSMASIESQQARDVLIDNGVGSGASVESYGHLLSQFANLDPRSVGASSPEDVAKIESMKTDMREARNILYERILYPEPEDRNEAKIYRIGTFLTYFITDNRKRYLDDSLIQSFNDFVYDDSPDTTVERLKGLGVRYLLMDLNAATIDRDPRHDLTRRYENLLKTLRSDKLRLVKTDSLCLQSALEMHRSGRSMEEYMTLAGVNFESYPADGGVITRTRKLEACRTFLFELVKAGAGTSQSHSYLAPVANHLREQSAAGKLKSEDEMKTRLSEIVQHGWFALFEIRE